MGQDGSRQMGKCLDCGDTVKVEGTGLADALEEINKEEQSLSLAHSRCSIYVSFLSFFLIDI